MIPRHRLAAVVIAAMLSACGGDSLAPGGITTSARVTDPTGDTYALGGVSWDLTGLVVSRDTGGITVQLDFSRTLIAPTSGDTNAMIAFVEFDTDQDSTTGFLTTVDEYRPNLASTGMGAEFQLALSDFAADSSVAIYNSAGVETGRVHPLFRGKQVRVRIPKVLIGDDDGFLNAAAIVGTNASPSDIIPETGHLHLDATVAAARGFAGVSSSAAVTSPVRYARLTSSPAARSPWTSAPICRPISDPPSPSSASSVAAACRASSLPMR